MNELQEIIKRMKAAGESEAAINSVIDYYNKTKKTGKSYKPGYDPSKDIFSNKLDEIQYNKEVNEPKPLKERLKSIDQAQIPYDTKSVTKQFEAISAPATFEEQIKQTSDPLNVFNIESNYTPFSSKKQVDEYKKQLKKQEIEKEFYDINEDGVKTPKAKLKDDISVFLPENIEDYSLDNKKTLEQKIKNANLNAFQQSDYFKEKIKDFEIQFDTTEKQALINKLQKKYDTSTEEGLKKANDELNSIYANKFNEYISNDEIALGYIDALGAASQDVVKNRTNFAIRQEDPIFSFADYLQSNITNGGAKYAGLIIEGAYSGVLNMGAGAMNTLADMQSSNISNIKKQIADLEKAESKGEKFTEKIISSGVDEYTTTKVPISQEIKELKARLPKVEEAIISTMDSSEYLQRISVAAKKANFEDGVNPEDIFLAIGESAPSMLVSAIPYAGIPLLAYSEYGNSYVNTVKQGLIDDGLEPTRDNIIEAMNSNKYGSRALEAASAAGRSALEKIGASKVGKRLGAALGFKGTDDMFYSMFKGDFKHWAKTNGIKIGKNIAASGLEEYATEFAQEGISQLTLGLQLDEWDRFIDFNAMHQSGKAGLAVGLALPAMGSIKSQTVAEFKNLTGKIASAYDFGSSSLRNMAFIESNFSKLRQDLKVAANNREITKEDYDSKLSVLLRAERAASSVPKSYSADSKKRMYNLLVQEAELNDKTKGLDEISKTVYKEDFKKIEKQKIAIAGVEKINEDLKSGEKFSSTYLGDKLKVLAFSNKEEFEEAVKTYAQLLASDEKFINTLKNVKGMENLSEEQIDKKIKDVATITAKNKLLKFVESRSYGSITQRWDNQYVFVNKLEARKDGVTTTGEHEILHGVLKSLAENVPEMGNALLEYMGITYSTINNAFENSKNNPELVRFVERMNGYLEKEGGLSAVVLEEAMTLLSEEISSGRVTANNSIWEKLKDFLNNLFSKKANNIYNFKSGKDVFNFVKDYSKAYKGSKKNTKLKNLIEGNYTFNLDTNIKEKLRDATSADKASLGSIKTIQDKLNLLEDQMINGEIDYDTYESKLVVLEQELIKAEESYEEEKKSPKTQENKQGKELTVYNASPKSFAELGDRSGLIYLATNQREAAAYAEMNRGNVKEIFIKEAVIASEKDLLDTMMELGIDTSEGLPYELIDPRFEDFYIGKENMKKVTDSLKAKGFKAARYEDGAQVVSGKVESIVVFDKSAISDKKTATKLSENKEAKSKTTSADLKEISAKTKAKLDAIGNDPKGFNKNNPAIYSTLEGLIRSKAKTFKTASNNIVDLRNLPGFDMDNMISETLANMIPYIAKFDPAKNDSLYGYINAQLNNRMKAALKSGRVAEVTFSDDVTEIKGLMSEEEITVREKEKPKYTKLMDSDIFDPETIKTVSDKMVSVVRVLKSKIVEAIGKNQNTTPLIKEIISEISTQADIDLKRAMGGKEGGMFRKFLLANKKAIVENATTTWLMGKDNGKTVLGGLPVAIQKQVNGQWLSYPDWIGKKIDRETTAARGATAGNYIVRRVPANSINNDDYLDFFVDPTGLPLRGRKESLAKELSGELGLELFVEAITAEAGPIFDAFEKNREILSDTLEDNFVSEITRQAERGTVKYSLKADALKTINTLIESNGYSVNHVDVFKSIIDEINIKNYDIITPETFISIAYDVINKLQINKNEANRIMVDTIITIKKTKIEGTSELFEYFANNIVKYKYEKTALYANAALEALADKVNKKTNNVNQKLELVSDFINMYSRVIRDVKVNGITKNSQLFELLKKSFNEKFINDNFELLQVAGGQTIGIKDTNTGVIKPANKFTSANEIKIIGKKAMQSESREADLFTLAAMVNKESAEAKRLITKFIINSIKENGKKKTTEILWTLTSSQNSIIRKFSTLAGVEKGLNGEGKFILEHEKSVKTIVSALQDIAINSDIKQVKSKVDALAKESRVFFVSSDTDAALNTSGEIDADRYKKLISEKKLEIEYISEPIAVSSEQIFNAIETTTDFEGKSSLKVPGDPTMLNEEFNKMLERKKGISAETIISKSRAEQLGRKKGTFKFFLPPNAEDFVGFLYNFLGKGKQGDADFNFFKEYLIEPFNAAENGLSTFRQKLADNLKLLKKELGNIDKDISSETISEIKSTGFTPDQAVRVYIWNRFGYEIPDITLKEKSQLLGIVRRDVKLMTYAKELIRITEQFGGYPEPGKTWFAGNSRSDLYHYANENVRKEYLSTWQANADAIFTNDNFNKLQAIYGKEFVAQLKEILRRMKAGSNRPIGGSSAGDIMLDYINGSIGTIMFLNIRSAVLQNISSINFINWHDNNIFKAGKTFADPKNFSKHFMELINSDFLKQRRDGLEISVSESEIATAAEQSRNKAAAIMHSILKAGYKPTQFADSFAIASGGTPFYINRIQTYLKQGMSEADAKEKAFNDFREIAEENQQSSRTDKTSNIQASTLGRIVFAFNNTPFQYTRIMKKAALDLVNRRGDWKTNVSKIIYYGAIQNIIFSALQTALIGFMFGEEDEEDKVDEKVATALNSTLDTILRGSGLPGAIVSTVKNVIIEYQKQEAKGDFRADHGKTLGQALNFSPPLGSKYNRAYSALKSKKYNEDKEFDLKAYSSLASVTTNIPFDRVYTKIDNMKVAVNEPIETWKRIALFAGWDQWNLGIYDDLKKNDKESNDKNKKSRSEIMKDVWKKRKEQDKKVRDSMVTVYSKMNSDDLLDQMLKEAEKANK